MRTQTVLIYLVADVTDVLLEAFETASLGFGGALSISLAKRLGMQSVLDEIVCHFSPSLARPSTPDSQWTSGVQELESRPPCPLRERSTHRRRWNWTEIFCGTFHTPRLRFSLRKASAAARLLLVSSRFVFVDDLAPRRLVRFATCRGASSNAA